MCRSNVLAALLGFVFLAGQVAVADPIEGKYYRITNVNSKKDIGVSVLKKDEGRVVQVEPGEHPKQEWKFVKVGDYYNIVNRNTGKALNVKEASKEERAEVIEWDASDNGAENQQWSIEREGNYYVFRARHSGLVLDVSSESKQRRTHIIQFTYKKSDNQHFTLERVK